MDIDPNGSAINPLTSSSVGISEGGELTGATGDLGRDEFLKLLMAQLEHQDPMEPMKDHEFVAQLATFSGLEQQILTNQRLEELQLAQISSSNAQLTGFVGNEITARTDTLTISGDQVEPVGLRLDSQADSVRVEIRDAGGRIVHTIESNQMNAGSHELSWPGTDQNGSPLPAGTYSVSIEASTADGVPVHADALVTGTVTGVSFAEGYPELLIGETRVLPAEIVSMGSAVATDSTSTTTAPATSDDPFGISSDQ